MTTNKYHIRTTWLAGLRRDPDFDCTKDKTSIKNYIVVKTKEITNFSSPMVARIASHCGKTRKTEKRLFVLILTLVDIQRCQDATATADERDVRSSIIFVNIVSATLTTGYSRVPSDWLLLWPAIIRLLFTKTSACFHRCPCHVYIQVLTY